MGKLDPLMLIALMSVTFGEVIGAMATSTSRASDEIADQPTNSTIHPPAPKLTHGAIRRATILGIMFVLSLIGNSMAIVSICTTRRKTRSTVYTLLQHLAYADLFVTVFCLVPETVWTATVSWNAGNCACKLVKFLQSFSLNLSTYILVVVGIDRFKAVQHPMQKRTRSKLCFWGIVSAWVLSALISLPQFYIFRVVRGPFREEFYQCVTYGAYTADWQAQLYGVTSFTVSFLIPLGCLIVTYSCTFISISRSEQNFRTMQSGPLNDIMNSNDQSLATLRRYKILKKAKIVSLKMTTYVVLGFLVCWTPYYVVMMIFMFWKPSDETSDLLNECIFFFGMSNSLINPLIYGVFHLWKPKRDPGGTACPRLRTAPHTTPHPLTAHHWADEGNQPRARPAVVLSAFRMNEEVVPSSNLSSPVIIRSFKFPTRSQDGADQRHRQQQLLDSALSAREAGKILGRQKRLGSFPIDEEIYEMSEPYRADWDRLFAESFAAHPHSDTQVYRKDRRSSNNGKSVHMASLSLK